MSPVRGGWTLGRSVGGDNYDGVRRLETVTDSLTTCANIAIISVKLGYGNPSKIPYNT